MKHGCRLALWSDRYLFPLTVGFIVTLALFTFSVACWRAWEMRNFVRWPDIIHVTGGRK